MAPHVGQHTVLILVHRSFGPNITAEGPVNSIVKPPMRKIPACKRPWIARLFEVTGLQFDRDCLAWKIIPNSGMEDCTLGK